MILVDSVESSVDDRAREVVSAMCFSAGVTLVCVVCLVALILVLVSLVGRFGRKIDASVAGALEDVWVGTLMGRLRFETCRGGIYFLWNPWVRRGARGDAIGGDAIVRVLGVFGMDPADREDFLSRIRAIRVALARTSFGAFTVVFSDRLGGVAEREPVVEVARAEVVST